MPKLKLQVAGFGVDLGKFNGMLGGANIGLDCGWLAIDKPDQVYRFTNLKILGEGSSTLVIEVAQFEVAEPYFKQKGFMNNWFFEFNLADSIPLGGRSTKLSMSFSMGQKSKEVKPVVVNVKGFTLGPTKLSGMLSHQGTLQDIKNRSQHDPRFDPSVLWDR